MIIKPSIQVGAMPIGPIQMAQADMTLRALRSDAGATTPTSAPKPFFVPAPGLSAPLENEATRQVQPVPTGQPTTVVITPPPASPTTQPRTVREAIADAAQRTSIDYAYLVAQAELESGLDPRAKAPNSTATGLFQFLETTWLATVKRHGPRFGLNAIADQIETFSNGRPFVADAGQRNAILALRNDPQIASLMAAGFAEDNRAALMPVLGRQPDHGELYLAHFLGAGGARQFLTQLQRDQNQNAAAIFPAAAASNRPIFYTADGSPRSLAGVMELINGKMNRALARVDGAGGRGDAAYAPLTLATAAYAPLRSDTATAMAPRPYAVAEQAAFAPLPSASATGGARLIPMLSSLSMSSMLRATFGGDGGPPLASPEGAAQVRRAYGQLKAFGL